MEIHSWLVEAITVKGFDSYNYDLMAGMIYFLIFGLMFLVYIIISVARKERKLEKEKYLKYPDYVAMWKKENREETIKVYFPYLSLGFLFLAIFALKKFSVSVAFYYPIVMISFIISFLFLGIYFLYKNILRKRNRWPK